MSIAKFLEWMGLRTHQTPTKTDEMTAEEFAEAVGIKIELEDDCYASLTRNSTKSLTRPKLDMCIFEPPSTTDMSSSFTDDSISNDISGEDVRVERKGRFTVTIQRSAYFTPKVHVN